MAVVKGTRARLYVDEYDFSGDTSGFEIELGVGEEDSTNLASTAQEFSPLLPMMSIRQQGYVTDIDSAGELETELWDRLGTGSSIVACALDIDSTGCPVYVLNGTQNNTIQLGAPTTGLMTIAGQWGKAAGGNRGKMVYSGSISAVGNQAAVDFAAAGSAGGYGYLFVRSITGTADAASFKLQSATTSGGSYTDLATFTVSDVGAYRVALGATVNRWIRLNTADMGDATGFVVVAVACVQGVTQ